MSLTPEKVRAAAASRPRRTSILSQARPAKAIDRDSFRFKALLLGDSGGGKSTSAMTLPGRKLVVELDGREESLAGFPDVEILPIREPDIDKPTAWKELETLRNELWALARAPEPFPYSAIIVDGFTRLGRYAMNQALQLRTDKGKLIQRGPGDTPSQPHYRPQMHALESWTLQMLPLPCHIVFTGHIDVYEDKELNTINFYPKITGKTRTEVCSWFNETYRCYSKKGEYFWASVPQGRYTWLKSAANQLGKYWEGDFHVDFSQKPCGFEKILDLRFGQISLTKPKL